MLLLIFTNYTEYPGPYCIFSYKRRLSNKSPVSLLWAPHFQMQFLLETYPLFNSNTLFNFLIPLAYLYWKWLVIITSKSIKHFTEKPACFICHHSSKRAMILLSRYYVARGGTNMNYAKKVVIFITMHIFIIRKTW